MGVEWCVYLVFWCVASAWNLRAQEVNSNICTLRVRLGVKGGLSIGGAPKGIIYLVEVWLAIYILVSNMCMGIAMREWCCQVCGEP